MLCEGHKKYYSICIKKQTNKHLSYYTNTLKDPNSSNISPTNSGLNCLFIYNFVAFFLLWAYCLGLRAQWICLLACWVALVCNGLLLLLLLLPSAMQSLAHKERFNFLDLQTNSKLTRAVCMLAHACKWGWVKLYYLLVALLLFHILIIF